MMTVVIERYWEGPLSQIEKEIIILYDHSTDIREAHFRNRFSHILEYDEHATEVAANEYREMEDVSKGAGDYIKVIRRVSQHNVFD